MLRFFSSIKNAEPLRKRATTLAVHTFSLLAQTAVIVKLKQMENKTANSPEETVSQVRATGSP